MNGDLKLHNGYPSCLWGICIAILVFMSLCMPAYAVDKLRSQQLHSHFQKVLSKPGAKPDSKLSSLLSIALNDTEKAWLIYRWVTHHFKHDAQLATTIGDPSKHSLQELHQFAGGSCAVYANVTHRLMAWAGLEVKTIYGLAKGGPATTRFNGKRVNHVWNAVKINGEWSIVDTTWGAGYVGHHGFQREQSDLYFLIPAERAVFSHFDENDELGYQKSFGVDSKLFYKVSEDAMYAASIGFDEGHILQTLHKAPQSSFVTTFDQSPGAFKVIDAPVQGQLLRQRQIFKIQSDTYDELMVLQGKSWIPLNKKGRTHSIDFLPSKGELLIMGRRPKQDDFEALLGYVVK